MRVCFNHMKRAIAVIAKRVTGDDARRNADRTRQHGHRRRIIIAIALGPLKQSIVHAIATLGRRVHVVVVLDLGA